MSEKNIIEYLYFVSWLTVGFAHFLVETFMVYPVDVLNDFIEDKWREYQTKKSMEKQELPAEP